MNEKLLTIRDLTVKYTVEKVVSYAVNGISLSLNKGEILALVGETGAGKTTTALSLMGLLPRYTAKLNGEIIFKGKNIMGIGEDEYRKIRGREISMIFQDPMTSLNPVFRVGEQISDVLRIHNKDMNPREIQEACDKLLDQVGIPPSRKDEYPHQFSGGMKQRIMIAIAIACKPDLLIADEPTTALDVTIQAQVVKLMRTLQKELGSSVIMITHDLGLVANFCDNVAVMYAGEIVEYGSLEEIFDKSRAHHPYTNGLFGSLPNIMEKADRLTPIFGLTPHPSELPEGCKFHPRCPECTEVCKKGDVPVWVNGGHRIQCHLVFGRMGDE
ncbi:MAG: ABC transporter ATP-binding protein [Clostridiales bacterium]|nr:ABC transporter ATP-binding protein [Bacteroidales bacterium]NLO49504.1 ABC transporter ATP-binding protein [Clostridiales bacterium]